MAELILLAQISDLHIGANENEVDPVPRLEAVVEAVRTLDDILTRMQSHLHKKNPLMRPLKLAERFFDNG